MKKVAIGIIGYGSMGKMLFNKLCKDSSYNVYITNRSREKLQEVPQNLICKSNVELANMSDVIFLCVRPNDIKLVLEEIKPVVNNEKLLVSLNGSVSFATIEKVIHCKTSKVIPSITAEINKSQTLVCHNKLVTLEDKILLKDILNKFGTVIELPESEMGMGSELVSCMPGFMASIFDVLCNSAKKYTEISEKQIVEMVLKTLEATSSLMLNKNYTFENVVDRVATKGGITQEGTSVVYENFPAIADELFQKTLEKRRITAEKAEMNF